MEAIGIRMGASKGRTRPNFAWGLEPEATDGDNFKAAGISFSAIHVRGHSEDTCFAIRPVSTETTEYSPATPSFMVASWEWSTSKGPEWTVITLTFGYSKA